MHRRLDFDWRGWICLPSCLFHLLVLATHSRPFLPFESLSLSPCSQMVLARRFNKGLLSALRTSSLSIPASRRLGLPSAASACVSPRRTISSTPAKLDPNIMSEYSDGVGAWGAWQVEPSKFTQLVVNSMRTLYVHTTSLPILTNALSHIA